MINSKQILLVDNEPDTISSRRNWLIEDGYDVEMVTTLSGAWQYITDFAEEHDGKLPLVLLDIMMPTIGDADFFSEHEKHKFKLSAPTAGLAFAEKLQGKYSKIKILWHSVRHESEPVVAERIKKLKYKIVQKDLQNRTQFLQEVKEGFYFE